MTFYAVARRRAERAVRIAVGADRADVVRTVLGRLVAPVFIGIGSGIVIAFWLSRSVAALLFGVAPGDPGTVIIAALTLLAVAGIAALAPGAARKSDRPSRRATRVLTYL